MALWAPGSWFYSVYFLASGVFLSTHLGFPISQVVQVSVVPAQLVSQVLLVSVG